MKRVISIILVICSLLFVCSCGEEAANPANSYAKPDVIKTVRSGKVAENDKFIMSVDSSIGNIILIEKATQKMWSTVPYKFYAEGAGDISSYALSHLYSSLRIVAVRKDTFAEIDRYSYDDVILNNNLYSLKIDNGVRFVYFFDGEQISIPVDYTLTDEGLKANVLASEIAEGDEYGLYSFSLLPMFTSAENDTDSSYLFVPSGNGALMYVDSDKRVERIYSERVYGEDRSNDSLYDFKVGQDCLFPVFAAKNQDSTIMGVITEGSELATINAYAGDKQIGYSQVYPSFEVRGKNFTKIKGKSNSSIVDKYSTDLIDVENYTVEYSILTEDPTYNGVAAAYRDQLKAQGLLDNKEKEGYLYLDFLGGAVINKSFLGIAYTKTEPATTVDATTKILKDIATYANKGIVARLNGYGEGGLDKQIIAGGFEVNSDIGSEEDIKELVAYTKKNNIALSMDFDLIHFTADGAGYSVSTDAARNINNTTARDAVYQIVISEAQTYYPLVERALVTEIANESMSTLKKYGITGFSMASLGKSAYGDYKDPKYYAGAHSAEDFNALADKIEKQNLTIATDKANGYAAVRSDYVFGAPDTSSEFITFDKEVPFYHMVLKGNVSCASPAINMQANPRETFLKAISTGSALQFSVSDSYHTQFLTNANAVLVGSDYNGVKPFIKDMYSEALPVLEKVNGATISEYTIENGVSCTKFDNGVTVYVNFNRTAVDTAVGKIDALSFKF